MSNRRCDTILLKRAAVAVEDIDNFFRHYQTVLQDVIFQSL